MEELKIGRYRHFKGNEYRLEDFAKDSETLVTEINKIIVELSKNGEIEKIFNKYGIEP